MIRTLKAMAAELAGLFVEDRIFALAIALIVIAFSGLAVAHAIEPRIAGYVLFAFLAATLVVSVTDAARR